MRSNKRLSYLTVAAYILMIVVNALANIIPINHIGTGEVSDKYSNLFAPAGYVFGIWLVIYILLGMYTYYQFTLFGRRSDMSDRVIYRVNQCFLYSSLLNIVWIFAWHYEQIGISLVIMVGIFLLLLRARIIITHRSTLNHDEKISVQLPFSVYLSWITIATIANVTTYLVSIRWDGFSLDPSLWTCIMITVGGVVGVITTLKWKDIPFALVYVWAYTGILFKHMSAKGFGGVYSNVIIVTSVLITVFVFVILFVLYHNIKRKKKERNQLRQDGIGLKNYEPTDYYDDIEI